MSTLRNLLVCLGTTLLISGCSSGNQSKTASSGKAYQATYSCPGNFIYETEHFYCDGAGHYRMDLVAPSPAPNVVHVLDTNTNQTTMWTVGVAKAVRRASQPMDPLVMRIRMLSMPKEGAQLLGSAPIQGHHCHGYRMDGTEVWFDDDYGCEVLAKVGNITTTLTDFSPGAPDASVFQPPAGYDLVTTKSRHREDKGRYIRDVQMHIH